MSKLNHTVQEARTMRTVLLPISTDIALADIARHEGRGKQELMREAITCYLAAKDTRIGG